MSTQKRTDASKTMDQEFEAWWLRLIQCEPHFAEYLKVKRVCRDAFQAGVALFRQQEQAA